MLELRWPTLLALLLFMSACANRPEPIDYDRAGARVATIALLDPGIPERPQLRYAGPASGASVAGAMFGVVGALATLPLERAANERIQTEFGATVAARPFAPREALATGLEQALQSLGYRVVRVPQQRALKGDDPNRIEDWLDTYPVALAAGADAILDVSVLAYGYGVRPSNEQYRPMVIVSYRLVRPGSGEVLMRKSYGIVNASADLPSDSVAFAWMSDISKDPDKVNAGLREGFGRAVQAIATSLK